MRILPPTLAWAAWLSGPVAHGLDYYFLRGFVSVHANTAGPEGLRLPGWIYFLFPCPFLHASTAGLAGWPGLAWLGLAWPGLAWLSWACGSLA